jgi:hypothetical protein
MPRTGPRAKKSAFVLPYRVALSVAKDLPSSDPTPTRDNRNPIRFQRMIRLAAPGGGQQLHSRRTTREASRIRSNGGQARHFGSQAIKIAATVAALEAQPGRVPRSGRRPVRIRPGWGARLRQIDRQPGECVQEPVCRDGCRGADDPTAFSY